MKTLSSPVPAPCAFPMNPFFPFLAPHFSLEPPLLHTPTHTLCLKPVGLTYQPHETGIAVVCCWCKKCDWLSQDKDRQPLVYSLTQVVTPAGQDSAGSRGGLRGSDCIAQHPHPTLHKEGVVRKFRRPASLPLRSRMILEEPALTQDNKNLSRRRKTQLGVADQSR